MGIYKSVPKRAVGGVLIGILFICWPLLHAGATVEPQATHSQDADRDPDFPLPASLKPAVDFWCKAFATWRMDQVALHDDTHLGVVYRLLDIPGDVAEGLTSSQRQWVRTQETLLAAELERIAATRSSGGRLDTEQRELMDAIEAGGGTLAGAADRVRSQRGVRERFLRGLEISGGYIDWFREAFRSQGLPEDLAYLPHVESSFCNGARSSVGAAGMWQFMPATGRMFMTVNSVVDERLNPVTAAQGAARYFGDMYRKVGNWPLAITSYNHGVGGMCRARDRFGDDFGRIVREYDSPSFGFASRNFYVEFLAARRIAKSPEQFFPEGVRYHASLSMKPWTLKRGMTAHDLGRHLGASTTTLASLNPGWTSHVLSGRRALPAGVTVWVPTGKPMETIPDLPPETTLAEVRPAPERKHRVAEGETLWSISRRYGVTVEALKAENGLNARTRIQAGNVLRLPDGDGKRTFKKIQVAQKTTVKSRVKKTATASFKTKTHRVRSGETPVGIASSYRVSLRALLAANNMHGRSVIRPGQRLQIPTLR